jgi:hypothetical protein
VFQLQKKKWALTLFCTLVGTGIAVVTKADLAAWGAFSLLMIGVFGVADVTDKKLNGGKYDSVPNGDSGRGNPQGS